MNDVKKVNTQEAGEELVSDMEVSALASLSQRDEAPSVPLFEGDGNKDIRIAVLAPDLRGTTLGDSWLRAYVQGLLHSNFRKCSAMTLIDRQNLNQILAEENLSLNQQFSDKDLISIGNLSNAQYVLSGTIQKLPNQEFSINFTISDASTWLTKAVFTKNGTMSALQNVTLINEATESLLEQIGITLTETGRRRLVTDRYMAALAEAGYARGIMAQENGDAVEALLNYSQAATFAHFQAESSSRLEFIASEIGKGLISAKILDEQQAMCVWLEVLKKTSGFFNKHPPFEITYDPALVQRETANEVPKRVDLAMWISIGPSKAGFTALNAVLNGLEKTGKRDSWGFAPWPFMEISPETPETLLFPGKPALNFVVEATLLNEKGTIIAHGNISLTTAAFNFTPGDKTIAAPDAELKQLLFLNVNVSDLTPSLTVVIAGVNGMSGRQISETGYIRIAPGYVDDNLLADSDKTPADSSTQDFTFESVGNAVIIKKYTGSEASVVIPESIDGKDVTNIGDWAFWGYAKLTSITIPEGVTSIGDSAFWGCTGLSTITIPESVTSIGDWAFWGCTNLSIVMLSQNVTSIGKLAFGVCASLTAINVLPSNQHYKSIDGVLFSRDGTTLHAYPKGKSETAYTIPESVTCIDDSAFAYCANLKTIIVPPSVSSIGRGAFSYCEFLSSITIPDSVTSIGDSAFADCANLAAITIPPSITSIGRETFSDCTRLVTIILPASITSIGDFAFSDCVKLIAVAIPEGVSSIGDFAFSGCEVLDTENRADIEQRFGAKVFEWF